MALSGLFCADVPLSNYSLTHCLTKCCYRLLSHSNITWKLMFRLCFCC